MDVYGETNVGYRRLEGQYLLPPTPREIKLWVLCLVIFLINIIFEAVYVSAIISATFYHTAATGALVGLGLNFLALLIYGNGLFGKKYQAQSLSVYILVFELFPLICYIFSFCAIVFTFSYWKNWAMKQYPTADPVAVVFCLWFICFFGGVYHFWAAWIINKYRKIVVSS